MEASTLHKLDRDSLLGALSPLWEDAGPLADALFGRRFATWSETIDASAEAIGAMDEATKADLLRAHPRIGAPSSELRSRSEMSWTEQGGDLATAPGVAARLDWLNDAYESRFGFPFVEWVAGRSKEELVLVLETRLQRERAAELAAGASALVDIARDRLGRLRSRAQ